MQSLSTPMPSRLIVVAIGLLMLCVPVHGQFTGACCLVDASCINTDEAGCSTFLGSEFLGPGTTCATAICEGACCLFTGDCFVGALSACGAGELVLGVFQGAGTACETHCTGPLGTGFTYQGRLVLDGEPVNGPVDLAFELFDTARGGEQIGPTIGIDGVIVADGLFTVDLEFGDDPAIFDGNARWLEITVNGNLLSPRQPVMAAPYALALPGLRTAKETYSATRPLRGTRSVRGPERRRLERHRRRRPEARHHRPRPHSPGDDPFRRPARRSAPKVPRR